MIACGWLYPLLPLLLAVQMVYSGNSSVVVANSTVVPPVSTVTPPSNSSVVNGNVTTVAPVSGATKESNGDEEKTVTEQIRTYIEDSVKSVKKAISKIGKFVGDLFDQDAPSNSTVPTNTSTPFTSTPVSPSASSVSLSTVTPK
ncbi:unnamed protein product [Caenorhabditis sp. 36 PRJEB53466]|nr:unnamed protein product [Caenorhabditis sp. 36 PRJEB53466]